MTIEIILPSSQRIKYTPKSSVQSKTLAKALAQKHGLWKRGSKWQLRGPLGALHPNLTMKNVALEVGECLKLEEKP